MHIIVNFHRVYYVDV